MIINGNINSLYSQPTHRIDSSISSISDIHKNTNKEQKKLSSSFELTEAEKKQIKELKERDREVRTHEQQHRAAAGQYARGMSFSYQVGPDNRRYAVGGQVNLDTSPIPDDPEKTIEKMKQIKRAALAPAEPSNKDRRVAAESDQEIAKQRAEIQKEKSRQAVAAYSLFDQAEKTGKINTYF
mgnify:CR=1 FL=1